MHVRLLNLCFLPINLGISAEYELSEFEHRAKMCSSELVDSLESIGYLELLHEHVFGVLLLFQSLEVSHLHVVFVDEGNDRFVSESEYLKQFE